MLLDLVWHTLPGFSEVIQDNNNVWVSLITLRERTAHVDSDSIECAFYVLLSHRPSSSSWGTLDTSSHSALSAKFFYICGRAGYNTSGVLFQSSIKTYVSFEDFIVYLLQYTFDTSLFSVAQTALKFHIHWLPFSLKCILLALTGSTELSNY